MKPPPGGMRSSPFRSPITAGRTGRPEGMRRKRTGPLPPVPTGIGFPKIGLSQRSGASGFQGLQDFTMNSVKSAARHDADDIAGPEIRRDFAHDFIGGQAKRRWGAAAGNLFHEFFRVQPLRFGDLFKRIGTRDDHPVSLVETAAELLRS